MVTAHSKTQAAGCVSCLDTLDGLVNYYKQEEQRGDEITVAQFAERTGRNVSNCQRLLARLFETGKYTRRFIIVEGVQVYVYRPNKAGKARKSKRTHEGKDESAARS